MKERYWDESKINGGNSNFWSLLYDCENVAFSVNGDWLLLGEKTHSHAKEPWLVYAARPYTEKLNYP